MKNRKSKLHPLTHNAMCSAVQIHQVIHPRTPRFYVVLAEELGLEADGGDSAAEFLKICVDETVKRLKAERLNK